MSFSKLLAILATTFFIGCNTTISDQKKAASLALQTDSSNRHDTRKFNKKRNITYQFLADSVLHGYKDVLRFYFSKYAPDSCIPTIYDSSFFKKFEGLGYIGDINYNHISDSFFILYPISFCQFAGEVNYDGQAYYFTDTTLPRLQTESYCCYLTSLFSVGDIDEDGVKEIGQYSTSCVSRYKSLRVYTLDKKQWKEVGQVTYDLFYADTTKPYSSYVRKTEKGHFEMLQITDLTDRKNIGKKKWVKFTINKNGS